MFSPLHVQNLFNPILTLDVIVIYTDIFSSQKIRALSGLLSLARKKVSQVLRPAFFSFSVHIFNGCNDSVKRTEDQKRESGEDIPQSLDPFCAFGKKLPMDGIDGIRTMAEFSC